MKSEAKKKEAKITTIMINNLFGFHFHFIGQRNHKTKPNQTISFSTMPGVSALERGTDDLERRLKEKIEQNTNFAGPESAARKLEHEFKFFDTNGSGAIDFQEFFLKRAISLS